VSTFYPVDGPDFAHRINQRSVARPSGAMVVIENKEKTDNNKSRFPDDIMTVWWLL